MLFNRATNYTQVKRELRGKRTDKEPQIAGKMSNPKRLKKIIFHTINRSTVHCKVGICVREFDLCFLS